MGLAEVHLKKGSAEAARKAALDAIGIADKYDGLPVLYRGYAVLGAALERLGRKAESVDAYASAAQRFERIRVGVRTDDVSFFVGRAEIQTFLAKATKVLEDGGRVEEAAPLKKWLRS